VRGAGYGQKVKGRAHGAWRLEQDDLKPKYLSSDFCSLSSGIWLRVASCALRVASYELRVTGKRSIEQIEEFQFLSSDLCFLTSVIWHLSSVIWPLSSDLWFLDTGDWVLGIVQKAFGVNYRVKGGR
jgi:hypothetical protein